MGLNDVRNGICLNESYHELFDAGLWYIEPGTHQLHAAAALQSLSLSHAAVRLLDLDHASFVVEFPDPPSSPPDLLLAVQQEFCEHQRQVRAAYYLARPFFCTKCGGIYKVKHRLAKHTKLCSAFKIPPAAAYTPAPPSSASAAASSSSSFPTPSLDHFAMQQVSFLACMQFPVVSFCFVFCLRCPMPWTRSGPGKRIYQMVTRLVLSWKM